MKLKIYLPLILLAGFLVPALIVVTSSATTPAVSILNFSADESLVMIAEDAQSQSFIEFRALATNPSPTPQPVVLSHVLSTGQSLSLGGLGGAISTAQPDDNYMLSIGAAAPGPRGFNTPLIPLAEVNNIETPSSGIANSLSRYQPGGQFAVGLHGIGGKPYSAIKKDGTFGAYNQGMLQAERTKSEAERLGLEYSPTAVTLIHGETDQLQGNHLEYAGYIDELQKDYQADLNQLTGQNETIPLFFNQMNAINPSELAQAQLKAHIDYHDSYLIGPLYQYDYQDNLHIWNTQSRILGEQYAKVIHKVVNEGEDWSPLMPSSVVASGTKVSVDFLVPEPPLVFDTTHVADRTDASIRMDKGFQVYVNDILVDINEVAISGPESIEIQLGTPVATTDSIKVAYAARSDLGNAYRGEALNSAFHGGNLRDSDTSVSPAADSSNTPLYNWGVSFEIER